MAGNKVELIVPEWRNRTAPCGGTEGCPAGTDISGALYALSLGDAGQAWRIMMESHPLRGTLGRVCYGFCETPCNRGYFDKPIAIQRLEAVIGDHGFDKSWKPKGKKQNGRKVAIIGSGPAGLTAGYFLALEGYTVTIIESAPEAGGMLRYGIPEYRLPLDILRREIAFIESVGVKIMTGEKIDPSRIDIFIKDKVYDSVIVATGAGDGKRPGIPGESGGAQGLKFLADIRLGKPESLQGKDVAVIGGGNVAMDTARSAIRLGAKTVTVVYRRSESEMPAHKHEVAEALEEGVKFEFLSMPLEISGNVARFQQTMLGPADESGRRSVVAIPGKTIEVPADRVFFAIGQGQDEWKPKRGAGPVFYAGDVFPDSKGTVIHAIASAKYVVNEVNMHFTGKIVFPEQQEHVSWSKMNVKRYFEKKIRLRYPAKNPADRIKDFGPYLAATSLMEGRIEAERCFACGTCLGGTDSTCDWCFRACGDKGAVIKKMSPWNPAGNLFSVDRDKCDGCGKCWEDCPRYAVTQSAVAE